MWRRDKYSLGFGVQNLFDTFPDHLINANSSFLVQTLPGDLAVRVQRPLPVRARRLPVLAAPMTRTE